MSRNIPAARNAYHALVDNLNQQLRSRNSGRNSLMEIAPWTEVQNTIDYDAHTFTLRLSRLDGVPALLWPTGDGYQLIEAGCLWTTPLTSEVVHDPTTDSYVTAPTKIDGQLLVSWRWSLGRWLGAWFRWLVRLVMRLVAWALIFLLLWTIYVYVPWGWLWDSVTTSFSLVATVAGHFNRNPLSVTPTPMPRSATPSPCAQAEDFVALGRPRVGNG